MNMQRYTTIVWTYLLFCVIAICTSCSGDKDAENGESTFAPEYDFISGCDIRAGSSHNFDYAATVFDDANTVFSPYVGMDAEIGDGGRFNTRRDITNFINTYAECDTDYSGDCSELVWGSYLAGVHYGPLLEGLGQTGGVTYNGGQRGKAISLIYVDYVRSVAQSLGLGESELMEAAVIHELGHLRADLSHLCYGDPYEVNFDYAHHNHEPLGACIMSNRFPRPDCLESGDDGPLERIHFCGKCIDSLKKVTW